MCVKVNHICLMRILSIFHDIPFEHGVFCTCVCISSLHFPKNAFLITRSVLSCFQTSIKHIQEKATGVLSVLVK